VNVSSIVPDLMEVPPHDLTEVAAAG
jgi:hypothetical protein